MVQKQGKMNSSQNKNDVSASRQEKIRRFAKVGKWFQILCFQNIPVVGFVYMLVLAVRRNTPVERKAYAKAYILYRLLVMFLAVVILFGIYKVGLDFVDGILQYAGG